MFPEDSYKSEHFSFHCFASTYSEFSVLTGIEKVDNEVTTILEGKKCIFCVIFFKGEGWLMIGLQSQQQTKTFVDCLIGKIIALLVNTIRSVDKPRELSSGRAKGESTKVSMTPFR